MPPTAKLRARNISSEGETWICSSEVLLPRKLWVMWRRSMSKSLVMAMVPADPKPSGGARLGSGAAYDGSLVGNCWADAGAADAR
jgi:hypothetical protein